MLEDITNLIDQAELSEDCPCGSHLKFGECCGCDFPCDCNSKLCAKDCCYSGMEEQQSSAPWSG